MVAAGGTNGDFLDIAYSEDLIDSPLSDKGIQQCIEASHYSNQVNFTEIWVSPLRRAMQTAYYMFRDHPNKYLQFKVKPILREKIRVSGDMPSKNQLEVMQEFMPLFNHLFMSGSNRLDLSELEELCKKDELWYFEGMDP